MANGFEIKESEGMTSIDLFHPWIPQSFAYRIILSNEIINPACYNASHNLVSSLTRVVCMSATHISFLDALGKTDNIVGVSSAGYVASAALQQRISSGEIEDIGVGEHFRLEKLIALQPDAVFVSPQRGQNHEILLNAGIKVIPVAEHLENHPLGRAEWIKFFGVLFDETHLAATIFDSIKNEYDRLKNLTGSIDKRPIVVSGKQYGGFWNLPGGRSYFAQFLHDAGAIYLWNDNNETTGLSLDFETVFMRGINADYWRFLVYSNQSYTYDMLLAEDSRYAGFKAFQDKKVIVCNTFEKPYFQKGLLEPQVVLADLISIFHPDILPEHRNVYYELLK